MQIVEQLDGYHFDDRWLVQLERRVALSSG